MVRKTANFTRSTWRRRRPQPNQRDEPRPIRAGGRRSPFRTYGTSPHPQASKFSRGEIGRVTEGRGERQHGASRSVRSGSARSATLSFSAALRYSPDFSAWKLACLPLGSVLRAREPRVSTGRCKELCISRGNCTGSGLGASGPESVCCRHLSRNSSQAAAIWTVGSAEDAQLP
jgi:hypothetical protein